MRDTEVEEFVSYMALILTVFFVMTVSLITAGRHTNGAQDQQSKTQQISSLQQTAEK